jgi:acrylyl-CoA reductase (NADPH)
MPFILRAVTLYGINCVFVDNATRAEAWRLLAEHVPPARFESMTVEIGLSEVIEKSADLLEGRLRGRTVVNVDR